MDLPTRLFTRAIENPGRNDRSGQGGLHSRAVMGTYVWGSSGGRVNLARWLFVVLAFVGVLGPGQICLAESQEDLLKRGFELRIAGDDEGALRVFERAMAMSRTPKAVAQVGLAEQALGRWEDADVHLAEALRAPEDSWVVRNRKTLDDAMTVIKKHVARVEVVAEPEGAEIFVNGKSVGKAPLAGAVRVSAGEVAVEARLPGHQRATHTVTLVGGQYQSIVLHLETSAPLVMPLAPPVGSSSAPADTQTSVRPLLMWGSFGLGAAGIATGVVASVVHSQKTSAFDSLSGGTCSEQNGKAVHNGSGIPAPECQGALDASKLARVVQIVGFASGAAFAITGAILALTQPKDSPAGASAQARARWACGPTFGGPQVSCHFTF